MTLDAPQSLDLNRSTFAPIEDEENRVQLTRCEIKRQMGGSQEEVVKEFVRELQTIVDSRPPISKAKMMSITKSALKGIKFYKHIVMNVEKFISKCKPEYKIPGLYVIDSVIRQSRHQYGIEKDVFASRFAKNILTTLENVEKCPPDDKNKISRVLNLWEKNAIFPSDLIKQMFDVHRSIDDKPSGSDASEIERFRELQETLKRAAVKPGSDTTSILTEIQQITNQLLESQKKSSISSSTTANDEPSSTTTTIGQANETLQSNFDHVLGDFDYDSDKDDDEPRPAPVVTAPAPVSLPAAVAPAAPPTNFTVQTLPPPSQYFQAPPTGLFPTPMSFPINDSSMSMPFDPTRPPPMFFPQQPMSNFANQRRFHPPPNDVDLRPEDMDDDNDDDHHHHQYNRRRSRSRSRSPSRDSKRTRSSSKFVEMNRRDSAISRVKETERRERRRKGLPPLKEDHLVVSSRTLWLGHLPKMITESDLREQLDPFGDITEISIIPPRGCAFVCFKERADAARCLDKMKDARFHGNHIRMAWAINKGVKTKYKDFWDVDQGCTYIPYSELKEIPNLNALADEGTIDEESLPPFLKSTNVQPVATAAPINPPQPTFVPSASTNPPSAPTPTSIQLQSPNRLPAGSTILLAAPQESPIRVGLPVQMMPHGAQIIQVQSHPHGQPLQVVQRFPGRVLPNGQIIHQMPFTPVLAAGPHPHPHQHQHQHQPSIQIQHHHVDLQDRQNATIAAGGGLHLLTNATALTTHHQFFAPSSVTTGSSLTPTAFAHTLEGNSSATTRSKSRPTLVQFHNDPHSHLTTTHFDEHHRTNLSSTDEQLLRLSNSSLLGQPISSTTSQLHPSSMITHSLPSGLLPTPMSTTTDEHSKPTNFPRRQSRFDQREEPSPVPIQEPNSNYSDFRGAARHSFNDRSNPRGGRGGHPNGNRGYFNNNQTDRSGRSDFNDNDNNGYRNRTGFNRGPRGGGNSHQSRFNSRGSNRRSSRSPDRHGSSSSSSYRHDHNSDRSFSSSRHSDRSMPMDTFRKRDQSNFDPSANPTNNNFNQSSINDEMSGN